MAQSTRDRRIADEAETGVGPAGGVGTVPGEDDPSARSYNLEIFLISFAALLLEISYTRVVSFKLFYYYTYLVIGLALLGIGSGGVIVAISGRLRKASLDAILLWGLLLGGVSVLAGYAIVAATTIDTLAIWEYGSFDSFENVGRLLFICLALFSSFIAVGVMIAALFARRSHQIGRLYFADLLGAGLACAVVVSLLGSIGPPSTIIVAGLILTLAGLRLAWRTGARRALPAGAVLAVVLVVAAIWPTLLPRQRVEATKIDVDRQGALVSEWSPIFRVDVAEVPNGRLLYHDALVGSAIHPWDGDVASLTRYETDPRVFPFAALGDAPENVMIIGAAGGNEVLTSLYFDAGHIDAIELNPVTYDLVVDDFAEYTGHLAEHEKVNFVRGDGRSYLARSDDEYDLIFYPAPDSYSASNAATAGAFVLSESYLYTTDTIEESFDHLGPDGIVAVQYGEYDYKDKPNRTTRYVATAREALSARGVDDPSRHIIVITSPTGVGGTYSTILVKETPFTDAAVERALEKIPVVPGAKLRYAPGNPVEGQSVTEVAMLPSDELDAFYDSYPYDVRPITDDGPFFWHFTEFRDVIAEFGDPIDRDDPEDSVGERVLILLLGIATLMAAVFLLLPFLAIRNIWSRLPRKPLSALYFASLGLGFIFFEIVLIQRLVLFLGYPTYSLTVTLASLLIFTGVGALLSGRYDPHSGRIVPVLLGAVAALTVFYQYGLPPLTDALLGWPLPGRVIVAFVVMAPLGICLGTFMPLGLGAVAGLTKHSREYVAWGWAVNGFASVIGAVLTTILAMAFGFRTVLFIALAVYVVALVALRTLLRAEPVTPSLRRADVS
jgi:spermidine synthase